MRDSSKTGQYFWLCLNCKKIFSMKHWNFFERRHLNLRVLLGYYLSVLLEDFFEHLQKNCCVNWHRVLIDWFILSRSDGNENMAKSNQAWWTEKNRRNQ